MTCGYFQSMDVTVPVNETIFLTSKVLATLVKPTLMITAILPAGADAGLAEPSEHCPQHLLVQDSQDGKPS